jgi:hypothetical protein
MLAKCLEDVMISVLSSSPADQTKDYEIGICCFCVNDVALRSKSKV